MNAKDKSLDRAKKSTISLAKIFGKEIAASLIPGGSLVLKVSEVAIGHARAYMRDRTALRIEEFHEVLLYGEGDISKEKWDNFCEKEFSAEDYHSLLSSAIQDEEDEKVLFYVRLFEAIVFERLKAPYKLPFIKAIRQLTCQELEIMRRVYVSARHDFKNQESVEQQVQAHLNPSDPVRSIALHNLLRLGFLQSNLTIGNKHPFAPSALLDKFVEVVFLPNELTPQQIGRQIWSGLRATVVSPDIGAHEKEQDRLEQILDRARIKCSRIHFRVLDHFNVRVHSSLIIVVTDGTPWNEKAIQDLRDLYRKVILQVTVGSSQENQESPIPSDITIAETYNLSENKEAEFERFRRDITEIVRQHEQAKPS